MNDRAIFTEHAPLYRAAGFWPRPVSLGSKACHVRDWRKPDGELPPETLQSWLKSHGRFGIGLLMRSPFPDGTTLGAFDIDHDAYTRVGHALLGDPPCCRFGRKGMVVFVRVRGEPHNLEFRVNGDVGKRFGKVAECLFSKKLCVVPPTIHPETGRPYRWFGQSLLEIDFNSLPILEI